MYEGIHVVYDDRPPLSQYPVDDAVLPVAAYALLQRRPSISSESHGLEPSPLRLQRETPQLSYSMKRPD